MASSFLSHGVLQEDNPPPSGHDLLPIGKAWELTGEQEQLSWPQILLWGEMLPFELTLLSTFELMKRSHRGGENKITEGYNLHPLWAFPHSWAAVSVNFTNSQIVNRSSVQLQRLLFAPAGVWGYHACSARFRPPERSADEELPKVFQQKEWNQGYQGL